MAIRMEKRTVYIDEAGGEHLSLEDAKAADRLAAVGKLFSRKTARRDWDSMSWDGAQIVEFMSDHLEELSGIFTTITMVDPGPQDEESPAD